MFIQSWWFSLQSTSWHRSSRRSLRSLTDRCFFIYPTGWETLNHGSKGCESIHPDLLTTHWSWAAVRSCRRTLVDRSDWMTDVMLFCMVNAPRSNISPKGPRRIVWSTKVLRQMVRASCKIDLKMSTVLLDINWLWSQIVVRSLTIS